MSQTYKNNKNFIQEGIEYSIYFYVPYKRCTKYKKIYQGKRNIKLRYHLFFV